MLVIGTTGQVGKLIVDEFDRDPGNVRARYAARKPEQADELHAAGRDAVLLDLDDPGFRIYRSVRFDRAGVTVGRGPPHLLHHFSR